ncbi:ABC transporter permease [Mucilaginibacter sp. FT3.2]|uniref:ABC transporter permease n=1 Tax=Mucilaginibacter sp. FT3.2 TaxID=2723090 RepID=UPI00162172A9|nr:ABC transporter permease [Mucilaginibacter sp. FT3.2]MBB6230351.1 ABC-type antimicrobial peptide transport system permease subunit [Mucilaginibacter sp. FT3.2]
MIKNYFKIAWRNLINKKGFSFINITGLAVGMAGAILIWAWVQNEYSFEDFQKNKNTLYKVWNRGTDGTNVYVFEVTPSPMGKTMKQEFPEVKNYARQYWSIDRLFNFGDNSVKAKGNDVDKGFLTMFSFEFLQGNPEHALDGVADIVITKHLADKVFGNTDPMNKLIKLENKTNYRVTGVLKDLPNNTTFDFEYLVSLAANENNYTNGSWGDNSYNTYLQLQPNVDINKFADKIKNIAKAHDPKSSLEVFLHPMTQWRLYSTFENGKVVGGRIEIVHLLLGIAGILLLIACINFMNLSTAQSQKRAREVGVRKVIGAGRLNLIAQFLSESILIAFIAGVVSLLLVKLCLPAFNQLTGKALVINYIDPGFLAAFFGFIIVTGLLAGSYPAFFLSGFKPVKVLKGAFKDSQKWFSPRKVLVVLQFTVAIVLVVATIVVYRQIKFAQSRDIGYNDGNLVEVPMEGDINKNYDLIKNDLINNGAVTAMSKTGYGITMEGSRTDGFKWDGTDANQDKLGFSRLGTAGDFVKTMGLKLTAGRDVDFNAFPGDSSSVLLNETAVKKMKLKDPIGKFMTRGNERLQIVGVFKDFIIRSPYSSIDPMVVFASKTWTYNTIIRLSAQNSTAKNLELMEQVFKKYNPAYPFSYQFVDQEYGKKFNDQQQTGTLSFVFAGLTIFISCLGLFGLAAYMAENRAKEIGIRKVLGASVAGIAQMLTREFVVLVIISIVIATPFAYYFMNKWLQDFTYRIDIGWVTFVLAGLVAITIAVLTVSFQAIKAALANPVKSIQAE